MKYIPINIDLRSAPTATTPPQTLFVCTGIDHDLAVIQLRRLRTHVTGIHLYNFMINGISISDRFFNDVCQVHTFLICLIAYSADKETQSFCPLKIAEFLAYHRKSELDADTVLHNLNYEKVIAHSFNLDLKPEQLNDDMEYISISSLSGNFAVALKGK